MRNALLALAGLFLIESALADGYTRPHVRRDGTYVDGYMRSDPNQHRFDNYSGRGNTNPYTGERGSQRHEFTNPPAYNTGRGARSPSSNSDRNPYSTPRRSR
jgi:hypothetical protein